MVRETKSYTTKHGRVLLSEEAAIRSEVVEDLIAALPELQMIRPRVEAQLNALAAAMGPIVDFRRRVPSKGPVGECCVDTPVGQDHHPDCPSYQPECDCGVSLNTPRNHHRTCPVYQQYLYQCAEGPPVADDVVDLADRLAGRA